MQEDLKTKQNALWRLNQSYFNVEALTKLLWEEGFSSAELWILAQNFVSEFWPYFIKVCGMKAVTSLHM